MPPPHSLKVAKTLGELVELAMAIRNQWWQQHTEEALGDRKLAEQWDETKQFWRPWFRGHKDADWQLRPKLYRAEDKCHPCSKPPDACVWMLDPYRLNLVSFHPRDESFGVALPDWETADEYLPELFVGEKLLREYPLAIDPPHLFQRLSSQRGHFTVFGTCPDGLYELGQQNNCLIEKITIPENSIQQIRLELELSGVSEATTFPDLEALSRELESVWESHFGSARLIPGNA